MIRRLLLFIFLSATLSIIGYGQTPSLVDIDGYRLDVLKKGSGNPTVVLVAGLGNDLETWSQIVPSVSEFSTVLAYSRSGLGRSDLNPHGKTAKDSVTELHALLAKLQLRSPYVLVGASYGGILVRLYTSIYPSEVAGLVIVEGSHEQQVTRYGKLDPSYPPAFRADFETLIQSLKPGGAADETRESLRIQNAGVVEGMLPLPDMPIAVLTSMKPNPAPKFVNQTPQGIDAWREMHDEWFRRSRNGLRIVTTRSGHHIQDEEPQLVIDAIKFVVDRLRSQ